MRNLHLLYASIIISMASCSILAENLVSNGSFESGFIHNDYNGDVGIDWNPWGFSLGGGAWYSADYETHSGTTRQLIDINGFSYEPFGPGGIYQNISDLEIGKSYKMSSRYYFAKLCPMYETIYFNSNFNFSVGVDISGMVNASAVQNWGESSSEGYVSNWTYVETSFVALQNSATVFLKIDGWANAYGYGSYWDVIGNNPQAQPWEFICFIDDVAVEEIPEPASILLLAALGGILCHRRRQIG